MLLMWQKDAAMRCGDMARSLLWAGGAELAVGCWCGACCGLAARSLLWAAGAELVVGCRGGSGGGLAVHNEDVTLSITPFDV